MKWIKKTYLQCIPLHFGVWLSFTVFVVFFFLLYCVTTVTPFIERSEGWSPRSVGVLDQSQQECRFFRLNSNPQQIFQLRPKRETSSSSLRDQLERRSIISAIKSSHLCRTSRHVWLSSSACDHCCAYQLICIMIISTYTTGASTRFFTVQEPSWRVISALAPHTFRKFQVYQPIINIYNLILYMTSLLVELSQVPLC